VSELARTLDERWQRNFEAFSKRLELKARAIAHLGGQCVLCGYDKCPSALDFHHLDPMEKDFVISAKTTWEAIEPELKKCALVCANCHREVHAGWHPRLLMLDEGRGDYGEDFSEDGELEDAESSSSSS
jgi:predicted HNH restriction endonuclease